MNFFHPLAPLALALGAPEVSRRLQAAKSLAQGLTHAERLETLRQHRLTPLLYQTLTGFSRQEVGAIPRLTELRQDYVEALKDYTIQTKETAHLLATLTAAGVEVILLKGADIRHRLYDDPVCRPMNDLDVLISPDDLRPARAALAAQGYTLKPWDMDPQPEFNARFDYDLSYRTPEGGLAWLDLHWEIREVGTFYRLPYRLLRGRATAAAQGERALVLAPEHVLLHLCLHTFEELEFSGLLKILDIYLALTRFSLNWDLFLREAGVCGCLGPVSWILRKMERLNPGVLPREVLERLAAYRPGRAERVILRRGRAGLLVASVTALIHHLPWREWPAFLHGKLWPTQEYLQANAKEFGNRSGYLRHLLGRARAAT